MKVYVVGSPVESFYLTRYISMSDVNMAEEKEDIKKKLKVSHGIIELVFNRINGDFHKTLTSNTIALLATRIMRMAPEYQLKKHHSIELAASVLRKIVYENIVIEEQNIAFVLIDMIIPQVVDVVYGRGVGILSCCVSPDSP